MKFSKRDAEVLLAPCGLEDYLVLETEGVRRPAGIYPAVAFDQSLKEETDFLAWRPAEVFADEVDPPDVPLTPSLPFPFTEGELAAFMLGGVGAFVAERYGHWADGPDADVLEELPRQEVRARAALKAAYAAYRKAEEKIGPYSDDLNRAARELTRKYREARREALAPVRSEHVPWPRELGREQSAEELCREHQRPLEKALAPLEDLRAEMELTKAQAAATQRAWLKAMVRELLTAPEEPQAMSVAGPENSVPAIPVGRADQTVDRGDSAQDIQDSQPGQNDLPRYELLATPKRLIEVFGNFTGMDESWFDNLTNKPALLKARKVRGVSGRRAEPAMFCPFEVMSWLIRGKRRTGRPISEAKGWELLERYFPNVYHEHSVADPREP